MSPPVVGPNVKPPLHDRASLVFPDSMKETARQFLLLYKNHTKIGLGRLLEAITEQSATELTKDDLKKWLGYRSMLGDRKFQHVDRFLRTLDRTTLPPDIRGVLELQQEAYLRDAILRALRPDGMSQPQKEALHARISSKVFVQVMCEFQPTKLTVRSSADLGQYPWVFFVQLGEVVDGFAPVDVFATRPSKIDFGQDYYNSGLECVDVGRDAFFHLLRGYTMIDAGDEDVVIHDAAVFGARKHKTVFSDVWQGPIFLPNMATFVARFVKLDSRGPVRIDTNFPFHYCTHPYPYERLKPWHLRHEKPVPAEATERTSRLAEGLPTRQFSYMWSPVEDLERFRAAITMRADDDDDGAILTPTWPEDVEIDD